MRAAVYARVSTTRQAQAQTIEQQLDRLQAAVAERGWTLGEQHVYRDDGYSGTSLGRPGLDRLRDHAALAELDLVLVTAPDRLARNLRPSGAAAGRAGPARLEGGVSGSADESRSPRSAAAADPWGGRRV
jgi:Resolvase, N terminal domain